MNTTDDTSPMTPEQAERASRNLLVTEWSQSAQQKLATTRLMVVGCGGLASFVLPALVAAGARAITLFDDDRVERSNLNRQVLHREEDIGRPKAERAKEHLQALAQDAEIVAHIARVDCTNARAQVRAHDVVIDCADGLPTKYLLNDACVLEGRALVHGAVTGLSGQVLSIAPQGAPCLRCLFPSLPPRGTVQTCQQAGVLAPVVGWVGSVMALEVLRLVGLQSTLKAGRFQSIDANSMRIDCLRLSASRECPACGEVPDLTAEDPEDYVMPAAPVVSV